jgi:hypothetical protein
MGKQSEEEDEEEEGSEVCTSIGYTMGKQSEEEDEVVVTSCAGKQYVSFDDR